MSDVGRGQARKLGALFKQNGTTFTHVYASDLSRAFETAELVVGDQKSIITDKRLRERAFGVVEGKSIEYYRAAARAAGFKEKELSYFTPEGGETLQQVYQRVKGFFTELVEHLTSLQLADKPKVVIVTHGGVIREYMRYFRDECRCDFMKAEIMVVTPNTGVNVFNISTLPGGKVKAEVVKIHDTTHLIDENAESIPSKPSSNLNNDNHSDNNQSTTTDDDTPSLVAL